jgi:ribosomal-protein-alanine N-acetyltransferase
MASHHINILTAVHDDLVVGYVCLVLGNRIGYIYSIAVLKEYRGKGIGTTLLEEAEQHAQALGIDVIQLEVRCNSKAVALYQRNGYSVKHIRNNYYGNGKPAYRMIKELPCWGCNIEKINPARKRDHPANAAGAA